MVAQGDGRSALESAGTARRLGTYLTVRQITGPLLQGLSSAIEDPGSVARLDHAFAEIDSTITGIGSVI